MKNVLPVASFSTRDLPPQSRYEAWQSLISAVYVASLPNGVRRRDIRAATRSVHLGEALVTEAIAEAQHFSRTPRMIAAEGIDHYMIQVYRRGVCDGTFGTTDARVEPGDIKIFDLAHPFHTLNTDFENITLTLPRAALAPLLAEPDGLHGRVLPRDQPMAKVLGAHIGALASITGAVDAAEGAAISAATLRLTAACLGPHTRARDETEPYRAAAIGQALRAYIERHLADPSLGPEMLLCRFRMSRAQMYRLFAADGGIRAYIQSRRLHRCFLALTDTAQAKRGIGEIALSLGFNSEAHFCRAFRAAFGLTPSEARAKERAAPGFRYESFISDWMRDLGRSAQI